MHAGTQTKMAALTTEMSSEGYRGDTQSSSKSWLFVRFHEIELLIGEV